MCLVPQQQTHSCNATCSIGNIKPLLAIDMPHCFGHQQPYSCSQSIADSITYVEASGWVAQGSSARCS